MTQSEWTILGDSTAAIHQSGLVVKFEIIDHEWKPRAMNAETWASGDRRALEAQLPRLLSDAYMAYMIHLGNNSKIKL